MKVPGAVALCLLLAACTVLRSAGPIAYQNFFGAAPGNYQWQGRIEIVRQGKSTPYLVAINTREEERELAVLSALGAPLFTAREEKGLTRIDTQLGLPGYPGPGELLSYLALAFSADEYNNPIAVIREGEPPWFDDVLVEDITYNIQIRIQTLVRQHGPPQ